MSRQLKRVPISFSWPLHKVWGGYRNPYYAQSCACPDCAHGYDRAGGRPDANAALFHDQWYGNAPFDPMAYGAEPLTADHPAVVARACLSVERAPSFHMTSTEKQARVAQRHKIQSEDGVHVLKSTFDQGAAIAREARRLHDLWKGQWCHHLIQADVDALVEHGRLMDLTRRPLNDAQVEILKAQETAGGSGYWLEVQNGHHPTAAEVNAWSFEGFGHDGLNSSICVEARCKREGVPYMCSRCNGSGKIWPSPQIKQQYDDWKEEDPPTGDGFQLWEDCSEGSPVSPVFATLDELCCWCAEHATTFAHFKATQEEWKEMLDDGIVHAKMGGNILL